MKILFVTGSRVHGGAKRHSITFVNRLAERGHECHAVYFSETTMIDRYERVLLEICRPDFVDRTRCAAVNAAQRSGRCGLRMDERKRR